MADVTEGMDTNPIRVMLAEDQDLVRAGFRLILEAQPGMTVVGEAADGVQAVEMARELRPDVLLLDIRMPRMDGIEVTKQLAGGADPSPVRIVVVTTFDLDEYVHAALRYGACGFILKRSRPALLVEAIRTAMAGDKLVNSSATMELLREMGKTGQVPPDEAARLTERELDVTKLVAQGRTNNEIAAALFITPGTVKTHLSNIQSKLGVRNRVGIAGWAWDRNI